MGICVITSGAHIVTEDSAHRRNVRVLELRITGCLQVEADTVVGLLILAPADSTDEALIIQQDSLSTEANLGVLVRIVIQVQLIQVRALWIGNNRILISIRAAAPRLL